MLAWETNVNEMSPSLWRPINLYARSVPTIGSVRGQKVRADMHFSHPRQPFGQKLADPSHLLNGHLTYAPLTLTIGPGGPPDHVDEAGQVI